MAKALPDIPFPPRPRDPGRWFVVAAFVVSALAAAWLLVPRSATFRAPAPLGKAGAVPNDVRRSDGVWYWVERPPKGKARLMAARAGASPRALAEEDVVDGYDVAGGTVAWSGRSGKEWVVRVSAGGNAPRTLRSGPTEAHGPCVDGTDVVWMERTEAVASGLETLPTLGGVLKVMRCGIASGTPAVAAQVPDAGRGVVIGRSGDAWWVAAMRIDFPGSTVVWRVPAAGGAAQRVVSVSGPTAPVRASGGDLLLVSPSRESTSPVSSVVLVRLRADGTAQRLSDWLPEGGAAFDSGKGVFYSDRESPPRLWRPRGIDALPEPFDAPAGHHAIAASEGHLLLSGMGAEDLVLSEVPIP
ncbi:MAG: hypothetical protein ACKO5K_16050 [Armatimonadota bacterium]